MYADDVVLLLSSSASGIQDKLKMPNKFCKGWCLTVYLSKSKILIFSKAGRHIKQEFKYSDNIIECVSRYKTFCSFVSFSYARYYLYQKGLKAQFKLCKDFTFH